VTGILLAMHYCAEINLAFISIEHIIRDVYGGNIIKFTHANGASFFFIALYIHIFRGIYYGSYFQPRTHL
jgi:ubiquinol-cytochrome c reductase cytochrome b subunit